MRTITVPATTDCADTTYEIRVPYRRAIEIGARRLSAVRAGRYYYYYAEETREVYRVPPMEVAMVGAGEMDDRGWDYSLWCARYGGELVSRPTPRVKEALGVE